MLIKEYHIPLPLTLEEYKIAQLYMIQKKSREESEGEESGVEIIENKPYTEGPFNGGQYTYKVYYVGRHIPGWLRGMVPKTALEVHEESWNAYPFTKTKFSVPFVEKFTLEIDTVFQQDGGIQENIFNLSRSELRNRQVDTIDIVNDTLTGSDYKEEEDPSLYQSKKTGRGPLKQDWIYNPPNGVIMCSYKLIKVEFRYWGLQSRIEHFIHDYGLRRVMLRAHRQAWAWQDEWVGLTMADIRRLEVETKLILARKLGREIEEGEELSQEEEEEKEEKEEEVKEKTLFDKRRASSYSSSVSSHRMSRQLTVSSDGAGLTGTHLQVEDIEYCALDNIAIHEDSDSEYFDAKEAISEDDEDYSSDEHYLDPSLPLGPTALELNDSSEQTDDEQDEAPPTRHAHQNVLLLVISCGNILPLQGNDLSNSNIDMTTIKDTFTEVYSTHYSNSINRVVIRFVSISDLIPPSVYESLAAILPVQTTPLFPLTSLPLFVSEHPSYAQQLKLLVAKTNNVYRQFLESPEGSRFTGRVCLLSDSIASLMVYDVLTHPFKTAHAISPTQLFAHPITPTQLPTHAISPTQLSTYTSSPTHSPTIIGSFTAHSPGHTPVSASQSEALFVPSNNLPRCMSVPSREESERESGKKFAPSSLPIKGSHSPIASPRKMATSEGRGREEEFEFDVYKVFSFGSPLGLVLSMRKQKGSPPIKPQCTSFYNIYYSIDPLAFRLEPLLDPYFSSLQPLLVPCYLHYPTGDKSSVSLQDTIKNQKQHPLRDIGATPTITTTNTGNIKRKRKPYSLEKQLSSEEEEEEEEVKSKYWISGISPSTIWWGADRIDYQLEAPSNVQKFYSPSYNYIVQARYWEAKELASFVLRQVLHYRSRMSILVPTGSCKRKGEGGGEIGWDLGTPFVPATSIAKWTKRKTPLRLQRMSPNHRAVDIVITSSPLLQPTLHAKFFYGPLNMATLSGEMVDIYILKEKTQPEFTSSYERGIREGGASNYQTPSSSSPLGREWSLIDSLPTDKHGRLVYQLTLDQCPTKPGIYPLIFLVKGDHTLACSNMFVLPLYTEAVVFAIDGALCKNFSLSGKDMKLKRGSVECTRMWQDKGYLPIYITGRPIIQKEYVMAWLALNGFPMGVVSFSDTLSTDSQSVKLLYLARLIKEARVILRAAYGSHRHLSVYKELGLQPDQIYLHAKSGSKNKSASSVTAGATNSGNNNNNNGGTVSGGKVKANEEFQSLSGGFWKHIIMCNPRPATININQLIGGKLDFGYCDAIHSSSLSHSKKLTVSKSSII